MKIVATLGFTLFAALGALSSALADDVAVLYIKMPGEKQLQRVVIEFYEKEAPKTVANFKKLVSDRFYNGIAFHRVFPHTLVQAGDPQSRSKDRRNVGTGGPGYTLPPEISHRKHVPGTVAMARLGDKVNPARVSNGSQFYVALTLLPHLDGQYTIFGNVIEGLEVLDQISVKPADTNDNPVDRITIEQAQIIPRENLASLKPKTAKKFKIWPF